ncbi:hypothetical protein [Rhodopila sp.]|uniref:hypothetical protein n=1 Tax=Rhodopila sp. TaxID=2480087 RepID=UPI003D0A2607
MEQDIDRALNEPRCCRAKMLFDACCAPTEAVWTGAPQWQIEGLRWLEIPSDMQKKHGFEPVGAADGPVKMAIFSGNTMRLYGLEQHAFLVPHDRFAAIKADYQANGPGRSNLRYGYVSKPG